jgi:hypothetical protein
VQRSGAVAYAVLVALLLSSGAITVGAAVAGVAHLVGGEQPASREATTTPPASTPEPAPTPSGRVVSAEQVQRAVAAIRSALGGHQAEVRPRPVDPTTGDVVVDVAVRGDVTDVQEKVLAAVPPGSGISVNVHTVYLSPQETGGLADKLTGQLAAPPFRGYRFTVHRDDTYGRVVVEFPSGMPSSVLRALHRLLSPYGPAASMYAGPP